MREMFAKAKQHWQSTRSLRHFLKYKLWWIKIAMRIYNMAHGYEVFAMAKKQPEAPLMGKTIQTIPRTGTVIDARTHAVNFYNAGQAPVDAGLKTETTKFVQYLVEWDDLKEWTGEVERRKERSWVCAEDIKASE